MLDGSTSTKTPASPSVVAPTTVHHCNTLGSCHQNKTLWQQSLSSSTPCVCSSVVIGKDQNPVFGGSHYHIHQD